MTKGLNFTKLFICAMFMMFIPNILGAQVFGTPIIEWTFADGIPESWNNESADGISQWEYRGPNTEPSNDVASRGSCGGSSNVLNSETLSDGFIIFDSNYWDDDGASCGANIGGGLAPGPHLARLTTNSFSLENNLEATLTFQQQYRHFFSAGETSVTRVLISVNGGEFELLQDNSAGGISSSANVEWVSLALTGIAGGESDVRLRFEFDGFYYWWMIDNITIFQPSENDLVLISANYSSFEQNVLNNYSDQEYHFYPLNMLPQMGFRARGQNIGGQVQTNSKLSVEVNLDQTNVFSGNSSSLNLQPGQTNNWQLPSWTPPPVIGDYQIDFALEQDQEDQTIANNSSSKDFTITPHTLGKDEGQMEDQFMPNPGYENSAYRIGNVYVVDQPNLRLHDVSVAFGDSSIIGSAVRATVYYFNNDSVVYGTSNDYIINAFDLNSIGENFMVHIPLIDPITLIPDTNYLVTVECDTNPGERMIVARSGDAIPFTSFVKYELNNFGGFMFKYPMVRMNLYTGNEIPGCTDPLAFNFIEEANEDDGSCRFAGCTDPNKDNYDPTANWDDGSCFTVGCMDEEADNYNPIANVPGDCIYFGCTNPEAVNFDEFATDDDGSCFFSQAAFSVSAMTVCIPEDLIINNQTIINPDASCSWLVNGEEVLSECTDSFTYNLNEPGTIDITYSYSLNDFETVFEISGIEFVLSPESPVVSFDEENVEISCDNCPNESNLQWFLSGEAIAGANTTSYTPEENGIYTLSLSNDLGCSTLSDEINVTVISVEEHKLKAKLFPNPSNLEAQVLSQNMIEKAAVFDAHGKLLFTIEVNAKTFTLETASLESGMYFISLQSAAYLEQLKLLVKH